MALNEEIISLLRSGEVSRINFRFNGIAVNNSLYAQVANAMEGAAGAGIRVVAGASLPADAKARYNPFENAFYFKFHHLRNFDDRAAVVHEATHAGFDLRRARIWAGDDEACAYLAEALYHRLAGDDAYEDTTIMRAVYAVLDEIDAGHRVSRRSVVVLRDAIFSWRGRHGTQPYRSSIGQRSVTDG